MGQSAEAIIAWGVQLNDEDNYGCLHESLEKYEGADWDGSLYSVLEDTKWEHILHIQEYGYADSDEQRYALVLYRARTSAHPTIPNTVPDAFWNKPSADEIKALNDALDHIGYTGDRAIRPLLLADFG